VSPARFTHTHPTPPPPLKRGRATTARGTHRNYCPVLDPELPQRAPHGLAKPALNAFYLANHEVLEVAKPQPEAIPNSDRHMKISAQANWQFGNWQPKKTGCLELVNTCGTSKDGAQGGHSHHLHQTPPLRYLLRGLALLAPPASQRQGGTNDHAPPPLYSPRRTHGQVSIVAPEPQIFREGLQTATSHSHMTRSVTQQHSEEDGTVRKADMPPGPTPCPQLKETRTR
jgi:hypothetical protein